METSTNIHIYRNCVSHHPFNKRPLSLFFIIVRLTLAYQREPHRVCLFPNFILTRIRPNPVQSSSDLLFNLNTSIVNDGWNRRSSDGTCK
jgi:hypothetical protein